MDTARIWVVRLPQDPDVIQSARDQGAVTVGYWVRQSVSNVKDRDEMREMVKQENPELSEGRVRVAGALLYNFAHSIKQDDWILTPLRDSRTVLYGHAIGNYEFKPDLVASGKCHVRYVN